VTKIFENPIKIPALVGQPTWSSKTTNFGPDLEAKVEVMVQYRDLLDKKLVLSEGDMFSFDDVLYEILTFVGMNNIYGLAEYNTAWKITARSARLTQMEVTNLPKPRMTPDDVQKVFVQKRGLPIDDNGEFTGDVREMRQRLGNQMAPIALGTGPRRVEPHTGENGDFIDGETASFNSDPLPPKKGIYED
jgi:hypothetical protein